MVSLLTSENEQGEVLGIFRSLGSLGRIIGPLWASLIYWRFGSESAYISGAILLILPILLLTRIPFNKHRA
jgi:MFS family permease